MRFKSTESQIKKSNSFRFLCQNVDLFSVNNKHLKRRILSLSSTDMFS